MTREEILAEALSDLNREDKVDKLPQWLKSAEGRINKAMRVEEMVKHAILPITEMIFPVPPDYQQAKSAAILNNPSKTKVGTALYVPAAQLDAGWLNDTNIERGPMWFTTRGRNIELNGWNRPGDYYFDLWYYGDWMPLANDDDSNYLSETAGHIYVEMTKSFGFRHLQEFERADACLAGALAEIQAMNEASERASAPQGPLIMRSPRKMGGRHS